MSRNFDVVRRGPGSEAFSGMDLSDELKEKLQRPERYDVQLTVVGSPENDFEQNQEAYGEHVAERIIERINQATAEGKTLVLDMATGASPVQVWKALRQAVQAGSVDMSRVVFMGHEEGWGTIKPGSIVDFEGDRMNAIESFGVEVQPIESTDQISGEQIQGNYMVMHLDENPRVAAVKFRDNLAALKARDDIVFLGIYGVGADGHVDEMQVDSMGIKARTERSEVFYEKPAPDQPDAPPRIGQRDDELGKVLPEEGFSPNSWERGFHKWRKPGAQDGDEDEFLPGNNVFNYRGKPTDELFGRPADQDPNFGSVDEIIGLGWRDLFREEEMIFLFNNPGKKLAFQLALEGSFSSEIQEDGKTIMEVDLDRGEGEKILPQVKEFAAELTRQGLLDVTECQDADKVSDVFRAIYLGLDQIEASSKDEKYEPVYEQMWRYMNDYVGRRAPLSRLIKLRHMMGRKSELVVVPEAIAGTKYETLMRNDE